MHRLLCHLSNEIVDNKKLIIQATYSISSFIAIVIFDIVMRWPLDIIYASFVGWQRIILLVVFVTGFVRLCINSSNRSSSHRIHSLISAVFSLTFLLAITNCLLNLVSYYYSLSTAIIVSVIPFLTAVAFTMKKIMVDA